MGGKLEAASPVLRLQETYSRNWPAITKARQVTDEWLRRLEPLQKFQSDNTAVVVFGSFARGELTTGSDADWSLLVDGPSDPEHLHITQEVESFLDSVGLPKPGRSETFGNFASSHHLIHNIGGVNDTNQNMTRRILLLLEARPITNPLVYERVVRGILNRYIVSDVSVSWLGSQPVPVVPRFLLNDIVRFWRTMGVDYAAKRWEQSERKWALRNAKLRMSRKLLFAGGLLTCFNFELNPPPDRDEIFRDPGTLPLKLADFFLPRTDFAPLDLIALALLRTERSDIVSDIIDSYDRFLALIDDDEKRNHLENLSFEDLGASPVFLEVRTLSRRFQQGLTELFFNSDSALRELTIKYGVF